MNKNLYHKALITSPIIALYGIAPIYLFGFALGGWATTLINFVGLTSSIFLFWFINIFFAHTIVSPWKRYVGVYGATLMLNNFFTWVAFQITPPHTTILPYFAYAIIACVAINTLIIIMIDTDLLKEKKEQAESENIQLKIFQLEAQKRVLTQQLQPHFLFNALSVLKALIKQAPQEAEDYVLKLSDFLRYAVQSTKQDLVRLEEEVSFTKDYLELQKKRFGKALQYSIQIESKWNECRIPVFALQVLVENALKHNKFSDKAPLIIDIEVIDHRIKVVNNKAPQTASSSSGTGLQNLAERYKIMLKKDIEVIDNVESFMVYVDLMCYEDSNH